MVRCGMVVGPCGRVCGCFEGSGVLAARAAAAWLEKSENIKKSRTENTPENQLEVSLSTAL